MRNPAAGDKSSAALPRGVDYLLATQRADGTYTMYRQYFPLLALAVCVE